MKKYSIALIPGDGIGVAVADAAWKVLEAASKKWKFELQATEFPWSCAYYKDTGAMMPEDGIAILSGHDAILLGRGWLAGGSSGFCVSSRSVAAHPQGLCTIR